MSEFSVEAWYERVIGIKNKEKKNAALKWLVDNEFDNIETLSKLDLTALPKDVFPLGILNSLMKEIPLLTGMITYSFFFVENLTIRPSNLTFQTAQPTLHYFSVSYGRATKTFEAISFDRLVCAMQEQWIDLLSVSFQLELHITQNARILFVDFGVLTASTNSDPYKIRVQSNSKEFSYFASAKSAALARVGCSISDLDVIPIDDEAFPTTERTTEIDAEAQYVTQEMLRRIRCMDATGVTDYQYTSREFISPVLIGAAMLASAVTMVCDKQVVGRYGRGPINYALLYKKVSIVITEAKNDDIEGGIAENIVQQTSARESLASGLLFSGEGGSSRKRSFDKMVGVLHTIPSYGVVTTAEKWVFVRMDHSKGKTRVTRSSVFHLHLSCIATPSDITVLTKRISILLRWLLAIIEAQKQAVDAHEALRELLQ